MWAYWELQNWKLKRLSFQSGSGSARCVEVGMDWMGTGVDVGAQDASIDHVFVDIVFWEVQGWQRFK